jgi:hypothetical protein
MNNDLKNKWIKQNKDQKLMQKMSLKDELTGQNI